VLLAELPTHPWALVSSTMPSSNIKIAICQFESELLDDADRTFNVNLIKMKGFVQEAAEAKAHVVSAAPNGSA
jgi:hypothetical protein